MRGWLLPASAYDPAMRLPSLPTAFAVAAWLLAACAAPGTRMPDGQLQDTRGLDALLVGEQHDADTHAPLQQQLVADLARRGMLAALTLEMADRGASTAGVPPTATEADVRNALRWNGDAWPWDRYGPAVMAAVAAGVTVLGANLPRDGMRAAMADASLDALLPAPALEAQQQAIREGHCDLLPPQQLRPMTRIQIARDRAMAQTVASAVTTGKTVVLLAGAGHVAPDLGVPMHLPPAVRSRPLVLPAQATGKDYCAELRKSLPPAAPTRAP